MKIKILLMTTALIAVPNAMDNKKSETVGIQNSLHFSTKEIEGETKNKISFKVDYVRNKNFQDVRNYFEEEKEKKINIFDIGFVEEYSKNMDDEVNEIDVENLYANKDVIEKLQKVSPVSVNLVDRQIGKEHIECLLPFKYYIHGISLNSNFLDSNSLEYVGKLSELKWVDLSNNSFFDDGLIYLTKLQNLFHLKINDNFISLKGISSLSKLKNLEKLDISYISFQKEDYNLDLSLFKKIKEINIRGSYFKKSNFLNLGEVKIIE